MIKSKGKKARRKAKKQTARPDTRKLAQKKHIMKLMHEYNNLKDATQLIIGTLATLMDITIRSAHDMYNLPNNE